MDLPPFHHHRYVPPPQPPPPNFPDSNPNFFSHHRFPPPPPPPHHRHPPPHHHHPLPPPPPAPLPPPPPPPHQHFTFHHHRPPPPIDDHQSHISNYIPRHFLSSSPPPPQPPPPPPPPRVSSSHRNLYSEENNSNCNNDYINYHPHRWVEMPPRVRVSPEPPLPPPPPPQQLPPLPCHEEYHPRLNFRFDDFERNERVREERYGDDSLMFNRNEERSRWDRKDLDFDVVDDDENKYRFAPDDRFRNVGRYDKHSPRDYEVYNERDEDCRWGRHSPRNPGMERDSEYGSKRRAPFSDSYDSGRFRDNTRVKENGQEFFDRSPKKKQVQKKSALLRIQLGKGVNSNRNRNRIHEYNQNSKGYFDESLSAAASFRGKEKDGLTRSDRRMDDKKENSPVQLDVSFKSNSLVAKAIVTSSSPSVDSDRNSTPRNRKIRKINLSSSPLTKPSEGSCKVNSSANGSDFSSNSGKSRKRALFNVVSADGSASGSGLQPCSVGCSDMAETYTNTVSPKVKSLDGGGNSAGASGTPLRKSIKRTKFTASPVDESVQQPVKDADELTKADKFSENPTTSSRLDDGMRHRGQGDASPDVVSIPAIALSQYSNNKVDRSSHGLVSEKNGAIIDESGPLSATLSNSSGLINTDSCTSQSEVVKVIHDGADQADRTDHNGDFVSILDTSSAKLQSKPTLSGSNKLVELMKEPRQDGLALSENSPRRVSLEVAVSVEGYLNSNLPMTKGMVFPVVHPDTTDTNIDDQKYIFASDHAGYITMDANPVCPEKAEGFATADVGSGDADPEECSVTQTIVFLENDNNENTRNSSDTSRLTISSSTGCGGKGNVSDPSCFDDGSKKSCSDLSMVPLEDGLNTGSLKAVVSVGSIEDYSHKVERKRTAVDPQLSLYSSGAGNVPADLDRHMNIEDASIISLLNDISAVKELVFPDRDNDTSRRGFLGGDPLSIPDQDAFGISANVASPMHGKKRKHNEGPDNAYTSTLSTDVSLCGDKGALESESQITLVSVDFPSSLLLAGALPENCTAGASFEAESTGGGVSKSSTKTELLSSSTFLSGADPKDDAASVLSVTKHQFAATDVVSQGIADKLFDMDIDQREPGRDCEFDDSLHMNDNLESALNHPSFCSKREGASAVNSVEELTDSFLDGLSRMSSPENLFFKSPSAIDDSRASAIHLPDGMVCQNDKEDHKRPLSTSDSELDRRAGQAAMRKPPTGIKTASSLSKGTSKVTQNVNSVWVKPNLSKNHLGSLVPSVFSGRPSLNFTVSGKAATSHLNAKPRTWRRTDNPSVSVRGPKTQVNPVPQQSYAQKKVGTLQSSYIRKGNSLVRNPTPTAATSQGVYASPAVYRFNPLGVNNSKKSKGSDTNPQIFSIPRGSHSTNERPHSPPLCSSPKLLSSAALHVNDSTASPVSDLLSPVATSGPVESSTHMDLLKSCEDVSKFSGLPECQTDLIKNVEGQSVHDERNAGKIIYVKRRSNQLVAALGAGDMSFRREDKTSSSPSPSSSSSSDSFYKRRKNQLIRMLMNNHVQEIVAPVDDPRKQGIQKTKQPGKGNVKTPLKFSLVWTLRGTESSKLDGNSVRCHKAWPYLFPWKRTTYLRNSLSIPSDSSLSMISRKLLLSRKRESIYTRSTSGFSLRRSKVLSVGGSNLKWSKSIERKSKKANEEATLAVAAADKSKKEQHSAGSADLSRRNHVSRKSVCCIKLQPGERIFRIGSERYKMDPTRKTLHRITNDEDKLLRVPHPEETKKSYVPRRLLIGNDEYVRIGNGNKLVRDPKKRTRTLASEKVRWSLHTVRLRLAKRRKFCQFFTRFGTCNKDDGKCPYIHDPSKIAVCTKFLNGSCSNPSCKLTHEVIPERMPDCSYFLQGLCSNGNCSYRHVNVNPSASICEGFLKGYCVDGNECRKKHTYACPAFEATGVCPQGSKCKLHHPKKRKGTRKATKEQKNARGRYFGSPSHMNMTNDRISESETLFKRGSDDIICEDGSLVDYIRLGISDDDDEMEQTVDLITEQTCRPGTSDAQMSTLDELIKPIRLMKKSPLADSSATDSPSEMGS